MKRKCLGRIQCFYNWQNVCFVRIKSEVLLKILTNCPGDNCSGIVPIVWKGDATKKYPRFSKMGYCPVCGNTYPIKLPLRTLPEWEELANIEIRKVLIEEINKTFASGSPIKQKKRHKIFSAIAAEKRLAKYGSILNDYYRNKEKGRSA